MTEIDALVNMIGNDICGYTSITSCPILYQQCCSCSYNSSTSKLPFALVVNNMTVLDSRLTFSVHSTRNNSSLKYCSTNAFMKVSILCYFGVSSLVMYITKLGTSCELGRVIFRLVENIPLKISTINHIPSTTGASRFPAIANNTSMQLLPTPTSIKIFLMTSSIWLASGFM